MASNASAGTNRWAIAWAGVIVMICLGTVYSWSIFTRPLIVTQHWSTTTTGWAFSLAIFFLGVGAVIGGRWQDRVGPRNVTIIGAVLWGVGNVLAGLLTASLGPWWLYLTYGVIGGFGLGMGYITPVATVTKWFPDKRGLASGMVVMGFGLGAFFYNQILTRIPSFALVAKHATDVVNATLKKDPAAIAAATAAVTPADTASLMAIFLWSGVIFAIIGGLCATFIKNPPAGYSVGGAVATAAQSAYSYTPSQTLRTPQFYLLWLMLFLNVTAGILIISNAVPIYQELTLATAAVAGSIYGFLAVFNGLGRFFWGAVSDRIGRNYTYVLIFGIQAVVFFVLGSLHSLVAVGVCFAIVLLCYGGGFGTMPSFNADYFGTKFLGQNYGMILTAWGVAGVVGPFIANKVRDATNSYTGALIPVAVMLLLAAILPFLTKKPAAPIVATGTATARAT